MTTKTDIFNAALDHLASDSVTSPDDGSLEARVLGRRYDAVRDRLLRQYNWNFAMARAVTSATSEKPEFGFDYKHPFPEDALRIVGIDDETQPKQNYTGSHCVFKVEGRFMLTDEEVLHVFYIRNDTVEAEFDPAFVELLAVDLAIACGYKLSTAQSRLTALKSEDRPEILRSAKFSDAIEGTPEVLQASEWVDSRWQSNYPYRIGPVWR